MDIINIKNLEIFARHGVLPEENALGQKFVVSVSLYVDLRRAGRDDDLTMSIDYSAVCRDIIEFTTNNTFRLIETLAEGLAEKLLVDYAALEGVWVEVKKPWAPVNAHLETVSIEIERKWHTAYIAMGSNMGDRQAYLRFAQEELDAERTCRVRSVSSLINTEPYGYTEQENFLNGCLELKTLLNPHELLSLLHTIENKAGRERTVRWGPRTLDLDIIFYDDLILTDNELSLPHIEAHKRDFVLKPLCEIAPAVRHPILGKTAAELMEEFVN